MTQLRTQSGQIVCHYGHGGQQKKKNDHHHDEYPRWLNVLRGQIQRDVVQSPNEKEKEGNAPTSLGDYFQKLPKMA